MKRLPIAVFLVLVALATGFTQAGGDKDFQAKGMFAKDDPKDQARAGPAQVHLVALKKGKVYTIDMVSGDVDSYLRLLDPKGKQLEEDDDSGGALNARIIFNCNADGEYKIVCTTFGADTKNGSYSLTVKASGTATTPSTTHAQMIGKPAPDFTGDFAVNGKPVRLSALKGKIVLVDFCDPRLSASTALLPKLSEWNKAFKKDNVVIVSATFYSSDIGQKLGFDKEEGTVITVKKADQKSDQAFLKDFATYHKIDHLLMALPKADALAAFDAYAVNGVPQLVLIDDKGTVRMVEVRGAKNSALIETEIKKLIAERKKAE